MNKKIGKGFMCKVKKKGNFEWNTIFTVLVGVIAVLIVWNVLTGASDGANHVKTSTEAYTKKQACLTEKTFAESMGDTLNDCDGDGYPDKCDLCIDGDDSEDLDEDGMADACEQPQSRNNPAVIACKFYEKESGICSVGPEGSDDAFKDSKKRKDVIEKLSGKLNSKDQYILNGNDCSHDNSERVWTFEVNTPYKD